MQKVRFVIDDADQPRTQKAVLQLFASELLGCGVEVFWTSSLSTLSFWSDVPQDVSRKLAVRIFSLNSAKAQTTVFLPGHIVPASISNFSPIIASVALDRHAPVRDWDVFVVNHQSQEVQGYLSLSSLSDYEALSSYDTFETEELPDWLITSELKSCVKLTDRPWYSAYSPQRLQWLGWVKRALDSNQLTEKMIKDDIAEELVRPSLLEDVALLLSSQLTHMPPDTILDSLFTFPEHQLSQSQLQLLSGYELQKRAKQFVVEKKKHKWSSVKTVKRIVRVGMNIGRHLVTTFYRLSLRPFFRLLRMVTNK